jgi:hypothetical protein
MTQLEDLRSLYSGLSTERLVAIVTVDASQYEPSAVKIALEELRGRGVDPMHPPEDILPISEVAASSSWGFVPVDDDQASVPTSRLGAWLYLALIIFFVVVSVSWTSADKAVAHSSQATVFGFLIAIGLFKQSAFLNRSANAWRIWASVSLLATILGVGVLPVFLQPSLFGLVLAVIIAVPCLGVLGTIVEPPLQTWRAVTGVVCFIVGATCLVAASQAAWPFQGLAIDAWMREAALPARAFVDEESGIAVHLTGGWVQLPTNNPLLRTPDAKAVLAHPSTRQIAVLLNQCIPASTLGTGGSPVDRYLDLALESRRKGVPTLLETGPRVSTQCGPMPAKEAKITWKNKGDDYTGASIAFDDGWSWWLLNSVCMTGGSSAADTALSELKHSVATMKTIEARIAETSKKLAASFPYLSERVAGFMTRRIVQERLDYVEGTDYVRGSINLGLPLLPFPEQQEYRGIAARAVRTLPQAQQDEMSRWQLSTGRGPAGSMPMEVARQLDKMFGSAIGNLPQRDRERFQHLIEKAVLLTTGGT